MLPPNYLINQIGDIENLYADLHTAILEDIAGHIRDTLEATGKAGIMPSAAYQIERLNHAGMLRNEIIRRIAEINDTSREEVRRLFREAAIETRRYDDRVYRAAGLSPIPVMQSPAMAQILNAGVTKQLGGLQRLTGTAATNGEARFNELLNVAYNKAASGAYSYQKAIGDAVDDLAREGIKVFRYASGRTMSIEAAVRMSVLTGLNQTAAKITEESMREIGASLVRTSAHVGARTHPEGGYRDHESWQGKVFYWKEMDGGFTNADKSSIMAARGDTIEKPIELSHPAEVALGGKELSPRQQKILDELPESGSRCIFRKNDVKMVDLSALTAKTGDEFAMFTRKGERLIVRGSPERVPLSYDDITVLKNDGYRWSGHIHPGISDVDLLESGGDLIALRQFDQTRSIIYNALGRWRVFPGD